MSEHDIPECDEFAHGPMACACVCHESQRADELYELERRKGLDCE